MVLEPLAGGYTSVRQVSPVDDAETLEDAIEGVLAGRLPGQRDALS